MSFRQRRKPFRGEATDAGGVGLKLAIRQFLQHRHRRRAGHRIAAEGVEITKGVAKPRHDLRRRHQSGDRVAVAHRFAEGDDVGRNALTLMRPEMAARTAEARLHFVADQKAARRPDRLRRRFQPAWRLRWEALVQKKRTDDKSGEANASLLQFSDGGAYIFGETLSLRVFDAIAVGRLHMGDVVAETEANLRDVAARQVAHQRRVAVIGRVGSDDPALACHRLGHTKRDVVRLRPRTGEDGGGERVAECGRQTLHIVEDALVRIARVGVERRSLIGDGLHHARVAVPDMGHVVVAVEIAPPGGVPEPDALSPHDMDGVVVEGGHVGAEQGAAARHKVGQWRAFRQRGQPFRRF